jgi:hypothetical protein
MESQVLEHVKADSTFVLLIYASAEACKDYDIQVPDALQVC